MPKTRKPRPKNLREIYDEALGTNVQDPNLGLRASDNFVNRGNEVSTKGDRTKDISISIMDIDTSIIKYIEQKVKPFTIGDQNTPCDVKIKCYIKPGEECPICYEEIMTKSSAFITNCGHPFHKKCLSKYIESKWLSISTARCPMCRCSLGDPDFIQRYRASYFFYNYKNDNELDKLEDFWISKDYRLPSFCSNRYDHYLGCNKYCLLCKNYVETGKELL